MRDKSMVNICITYDVITMEGDKGEACCTLYVPEDVFLILAQHTPGSEDVQKVYKTWLEQVLAGIEALRNRDYITGSIKDIGRN